MFEIIIVFLGLNYIVINIVKKLMLIFCNKNVLKNMFVLNVFIKNELVWIKLFKNWLIVLFKLIVVVLKVMFLVCLFLFDVMIIFLVRIVNVEVILNLLINLNVFKVYILNICFRLNKICIKL